MLTEPKVKEVGKRMPKHVFVTARTDIYEGKLADELTTAGIVHNGISYQKGVHVRVDIDAATLTPSEITTIENVIINHDPTEGSILAVLTSLTTDIDNATTVAQLKPSIQTLRDIVELLAKANGFR